VDQLDTSEDKGPALQLWDLLVRAGTQRVGQAGDNVREFVLGEGAQGLGLHVTQRADRQSSLDARRLSLMCLVPSGVKRNNMMYIAIRSSAVTINLGQRGAGLQPLQ
jgi:hypothetical protein